MAVNTVVEKAEARRAEEASLGIATGRSLAVLPTGSDRCQRGLASTDGSTLGRRTLSHHTFVTVVAQEKLRASRTRSHLTMVVLTPDSADRSPRPGVRVVPSRAEDLVRQSDIIGRWEESATAILLGDTDEAGAHACALRLAAGAKGVRAAVHVLTRPGVELRVVKAPMSGASSLPDRAEDGGCHSASTAAPVAGRLGVSRSFFARLIPARFRLWVALALGRTRHASSRPGKVRSQEVAEDCGFVGTRSARTGPDASVDAVCP